MDDGYSKSPAEDEATFNMDEWMKELLPDDDDEDDDRAHTTEFGVGAAGVPLPSSSVNNYNYEIKPVKLDDGYQIAATSPNVLPSLCQNSKPMLSASGGSNVQAMRQNIPSIFSTRCSDFPESHNSCNIVSQHQRHQFQHQVQANRSSIQAFALHSNSHISNLWLQSPIHKRSSTFGMLQQQHKLGNQSSSFMMNGHESFSVLQHPDQTSNKQIMQLPQKMQLQQKLQRTDFLHSQNAVDQKKLGNQSEPIHGGPSQGLFNFSSQAGFTNSSDWVDPVFQQIQSMKDMYMSEVIKLFERSRELRHQATNAESVAKHENNRNLAERIIRFLQMSKVDLIMNYRKEKAYSMLNEVKTYLDRAIVRNRVPLQQHPQRLVESSTSQVKTPQLQQRVNFLHYNMSNQCLNGKQNNMPPSLRTQQGINKFQVGPSVGLRKGENSSLMSSDSYSLLGSRFQKRVEQEDRKMLLHPSNGATHNNNTSSLHQKVASWGDILNSLDSVSSLTQNSMLTSSQQTVKVPSLKRPFKQPLTGTSKHQDFKRGYILGFNQKQSSPSSYSIASPKNSQHSSTHIEPKDLSSAFSNSAAPLLSTPSPSVIASPLTPVTPSSMSVIDSEKSSSIIHSSLLEESRKNPEIPATPSQLANANRNHQSLTMDEIGLLKSPLAADSTSPTVDQPSHPKENPLKRLVEVVKSLSTRTLKSALLDIEALTNVTDRTARSLFHSESNRVFVRDLADDIRNYEDGNFSLIYGTSEETRMKRRLNSFAFDDSTSDMKLDADSRVKRPKKEPYNLILQEIKEINQMLIESVVDVIKAKDVFGAEADKGILIRCRYKPVGFSGEIRIHGSSEKMFPTLLLELVVTPDYPNSSPVVSEALPPHFSGDAEGKDLWMKAKSIFSLSLRKCSHPMSLKEIAKTWDVSAREVFQEFAEQRGGGSFSSRYGMWENSIPLLSIS